MRWTVHGERRVHESEWVSLSLVDVEVPGGHRFAHHVVRAHRPAVGVVVHDEQGNVLLLWLHRFITDEWGWKIPAGGVDAGEGLEEAAAREVLEETGWALASLRPLLSYRPSNGLSDQEFHAFVARAAESKGHPTDTTEAERIEWFGVSEVRGLIQEGVVRRAFR